MKKRTRRFRKIPSFNISNLISDSLSKTLKIPKKISNVVIRDVFNSLFRAMEKYDMDLVITGLGRFEARHLSGSPVEIKAANCRTLYPPGSYKIKFRQTLDSKNRSKCRIFQKMKDGRYQVNKWYEHLYHDNGTPKDVPIEDWFDYEKVSKLLYMFSMKQNKSKEESLQ